VTQPEQDRGYVDGPADDEGDNTGAAVIKRSGDHPAASGGRDHAGHPSRVIRCPTNGAAATEPTVITTSVSPRSPIEALKLRCIAGQAAPTAVGQPQEGERPEAETVEPARRCLRAAPVLRDLEP